MEIKYETICNNFLILTNMFTITHSVLLNCFPNDQFPYSIPFPPLCLVLITQLAPLLLTRAFSLPLFLIILLFPLFHLRLFSSSCRDPSGSPKTPEVGHCHEHISLILHAHTFSHQTHTHEYLSHPSQSHTLTPQVQMHTKTCKLSPKLI